MCIACLRLAPARHLASPLQASAFALDKAPLSTIFRMALRACVEAIKVLPIGSFVTGDLIGCPAFWQTNPRSRFS